MCHQFVHTGDFYVLFGRTYREKKSNFKTNRSFHCVIFWMQTCILLLISINPQTYVQTDGSPSVFFVSISEHVVP